MTTGSYRGASSYRSSPRRHRLMRDPEKPSREAADAVVPFANAEPTSRFLSQGNFCDYLESARALALTIPPGVFPLPTTWSNELVDVRFWHKADITRLSSDVRFWG